MRLARRTGLFLSMAFVALAQAAMAKDDLSDGGAVLSLPAIDAAKALREDEASDKAQPGPRRYALGHAVTSVTIDGAQSRGGRWSPQKDGRLHWELEVKAPGALSLDLGFKPFRLPSGAELKLIDARTGVTHATFTDADNPMAGEFWTPLVRSDAVRLELSLPAEKREFLRLGLDTVHHGYRPLFATRDALGTKSGSCNVDVVCPEGNNWRDQIRSVAVVAYNNSGDRSGNRCSGQFVNSTAPSGGPLFLSANHCEIEAASARVYFNFENSTCRAAGSVASGQPGNGPLTTTLFGGTLLALTDPEGGVAASDFYLMRFNSPAPAAANLFLSGWDRRDSAPTTPSTAIHHPEGDEKRISFENQPLSIAAYLGNTGTGNTHLRIADWDVGTTEPGSSGSGLWNSDKRLIGVLSGGQAACGNDLPDWYGRLAHAWEGLGTSDRRLRDWLDNGETGAQFLDGRNTCAIGTVTLSSSAFSTAPSSGTSVTFSATTAGASGTVRYAWDVDGDGEVDREGTQSSISVTYPQSGSYQVRVTATDAGGCNSFASSALDVIGATLTATAGTRQQVCGDNDGNIEPGERWRLPVTVRNNGASALPAGARALFMPGAASTGALPIGPNSFGYQATTNALGSCGFNFVDIATGTNAVAALATSVANGNDFGPLDDARTTQTIALGGAGLKLYGQTYTQAVMSTNGYVSFSATESGGDFSNDCGGGYNNGAVGPQLRVHHDDLVVSTQTGAGLRYRYFATCPRAGEADNGQAQGCHVFQWSRMAFFGAGGDFEFQALVYERNGQVSYQYRSAAPDVGAGATIGLSNVAGDDPLNTSCDDAGAAPAQRAVCIFAPGATPVVNAGLRLESPTIAVPALAAGAQATVDVPIAIKTDATCGAPLALDYFGTAAPGSFSLGQNSVLNTSVGGGSACQVSNNCPAQVANIAVRPGVYSNPQREGNGIVHFTYGSVYGGAWYTALPDRTPTWYTATGDYADGIGSAPLLQFRNTGTSSNLVTENAPIGRAWVAQIDNDSVLYGWRLNNGVAGAELMDAAPFGFAQPNHSQVWYSLAENGWGLAIESLNLGGGNALEFIGAYVYDSNGIARWVVGDSTSLTGGNVALTMHRPHCPACPWFPDWASQGASAGSLSRTYSGATTGTLNTSINLPGPLSGSWNRTNLPITTIGVPVADPQ